MVGAASPNGRIRALTFATLEPGQPRTCVWLDTEFGYPDASDLSATVVTLHAATGPRKVVISGYDESHDRDVSFREHRHRRQLRALVDGARALRGDAELVDYRVERVAVRELETDTPLATAQAQTAYAQA